MRYLLSVLLIFSALAAQAQKAGSPKKKAVIDQVSGQPYGMAGCGLGSIIFADKPGFVQVFGVTSNAISSNQTFAISLGTLNCGESGMAADAQSFIENNQIALQNDITRGQGETLASLQEVLKCQNDTFSQELTEAYRREFPTGNATTDQLSTIAFKSCEI